MTETKTCSCCKQTKPVSEFHRRGGGGRGYRYRCKACDHAARKQGRSHESQLAYEIVMHNHDPSFPLSPEAEAIVYTTEPPPAGLYELYKKRLKLAEQGRLRRSRALRRLEEQRRLQERPAEIVDLAA